MTFAATAGLGAIAGATIFLGLPVGRARNLSVRTKLALSMLSAGILAFLFMDVGAGALGIVETRLDAFKHQDASLWPVIGLFALLSVGFLAGVGGIATAQRRLAAPPAAADRRRRVDRDDERGRAAGAPERVRWGGAADRHGDRRGDRGAQLRRGAGHRRLGAGR